MILRDLFRFSEMQCDGWSWIQTQISATADPAKSCFWKYRCVCWDSWLRLHSVRCMVNLRIQLRRTKVNQRQDQPPPFFFFKGKTALQCCVSFRWATTWISCVLGHWARQAPLSMGILQARILECIAWNAWNTGMPPGDLPNLGIEPSSHASQEILYRLSHQGSPWISCVSAYISSLLSLPTTPSAHPCRLSQGTKLSSLLLCSSFPWAILHIVLYTHSHTHTHIVYRFF